MNETSRIVWATAFALFFQKTQQYELAIREAARTVMALHVASANSPDMGSGPQRELLEQFTKR